MKFKKLIFLLCTYVCLPATLIPAAPKQAPLNKWFRSSFPESNAYLQKGSIGLAHFLLQKQAKKAAQRITQPTKCKLVKISTLQQNNSLPWTLRGTNLETSGNGGVRGDSELLWKDVRTNDVTNCGYHVLKNIIAIMTTIYSRRDQFYQEIINQDSMLRQQLLSLDYFLDYLGRWAPIVFQKRKQDIINELQRKKIIDQTFTVDMPLNKELLKVRRPDLSESIRSFINMNEGFIKVEELIGSEMNLLLKTVEDNEFRERKNNIIVIEYDASPELASMGFDPIGEANRERIQQFLLSNNDTLGIIWTETGGFNHWIGFVAYKKNELTTVYYLNSIDSRQPRHADAVLKLLCPAGFNTRNDIETVRKVVDMVKSVAQ